MKLIKQGMLAASCALLAAIALPAQAAFINDTPADGPYYLGANNHGYLPDVIGSDNTFAIAGMNVTRSGNILTVSIDTNFAGRGDDKVLPGTTSGQANSYVGGVNQGIGYGDLFLASNWDPDVTGSNYENDDNVTGTKWLYGFSLDNRWSANGTNLGGTLYKLNSGNNNTDALLSDDFLKSTATFRNGQEVAVDKASNGVTAINNSSDWSVNDSTIDFIIDLNGTDLASGSTFALHWAMTCANDTIEGEVTGLAAVPVPAAVWLFGSGLLGLVGVARRRKHS